MKVAYANIADLLFLPFSEEWWFYCIDLVLHKTLVRKVAVMLLGRQISYR